jgi:HEAT repeat protein
VLIVAKVAEALIQPIQIATMDACERVRGNVTATIAAILKAFDRAAWISSAVGSAVNTVVVMLMDLLNDDSSAVQLAVVERIADMGVSSRGAPSSALTFQKIEESVAKLCHSLSQNPTWRVRERYAYLLGNIATRFLIRGQETEAFAKQSFIPLLIDVMFDKVKAVRDAAIAAIVNVCDEVKQARRQHLDYSMLLDEFIWPAISQHPKASANYLARMSLLHCATKLNISKAQFFALVDSLAHDSIVNVRMSVGRVLAQLLKKHHAPVISGSGDDMDKTIAMISEQDRNGPLLRLLRQLVEDPSPDVRECASKALANCF